MCKYTSTIESKHTKHANTFNYTFKSISEPRLLHSRPNIYFPMHGKLQNIISPFSSSEKHKTCKKFSDIYVLFFVSVSNLLQQFFHDLCLRKYYVHSPDEHCGKDQKRTENILCALSLNIELS